MPRIQIRVSDSEQQEIKKEMRDFGLTSNKAYLDELRLLSHLAKEGLKEGQVLVLLDEKTGEYQKIPLSGLERFRLSLLEK